MSIAYIDDVITNKNFLGNVVILLGGEYFAIRQPDSGLSIASPYNRSIASLTLNPTTIDIRRVTTTISNFSFRILDVANIVTSLVLGDARNLINTPVQIWVGRTNITGNPDKNMAFADYYALPVTYIKKADHADDSYVFNVTEQTERMAKPIFDFKSALGVDILAGTTTWTMRDDISGFPTSGFLKVDDEFASYAGVDLVNNRFTGVIRGELNSVPAEHAADSDVFFVQTVTDNPINIILKILTSGGGGGAYDVLESGLGIDSSLIDIAEIEALRDNQFSGYMYTRSFYDLDSALKELEDQFLMPNQLRFTNSINSKLTLALLDKAVFVDEDNVIDHDTILKFPKWSIDGNKVTNVIEVQWDYQEGTNVYRQRSEYTDAASISTYGKQTPLKYAFKGIKADLDGQALVDDFATRLLARLSTPTPEISFSTQIDKSLQNIGDKAYLVSNKIPAADGSLNFDSYLEIISRGINQTSGDVNFKMAFTSFTNIRSAFIAPSDIITSFVSQKKVNVASGRAAFYKVGWVMRLWDEAANEYTADPPNVIAAIGGGSTTITDEGGDGLLTEDGDSFVTEDSTTNDTITFQDDWTTILSNNNYRIRFADYDDAVASQKRYGFVGVTGGADFADGKPTYRITY